MSPARRSVLVWLTLVAATLASWAVAHPHGAADRRGPSVLVLLVAFAKVWLVGREFMELRGAPRVLQLLFTTWVVGVCTSVLTLYLAGG